MSDDIKKTNENFQRLLSELSSLGTEATRNPTEDPLYKQFIQRFPADQLTKMSLADYCVGKGDGDSFCWWIERGLQSLMGRYAPGTSRGHILYFQKDGTVYKHRHLRELGDAEALAYTLRIQSCIALADMSLDLGWIDDDQQLYQRAGVQPRVTVGDGRKLRLLSIYHPDSTVPISSSSHLGHFLKVLGCPEADIPPQQQPIARMLMLREYMRLAQQTISGLSPVGFMRALYKPELGLAPTDDGDDDINSEDEISILLTDGAVRNGYVRIPKTQTLFPIDCIAQDEKTVVPQFILVLPDSSEIETCLLANRGRIKARFNKIFNSYTMAKGDRVRIQKSGERRFEMTFERNNQAGTMTIAPGSQPAMAEQTMELPLNQILYGPPGTGKTYSTIDAALAVLDPGYLAQHRSDRTALKSRFDALAHEHRIRFVTFHQSFSYEDFVEGLRATTNEQTGQLRYEVVDGVFKSLCKAAASKVTLPQEPAASAAPIDIKGRRIWKMSLGNTLGSDAVVYDECIENGYALLGYGGRVDFTGCTSRDDVLNRFDANGLKPQTDYAVTSVTAFVTRMKPGDLLIISDGNFKFRAIGEICSDYQYKPHLDIADDYSQMRAVKWLRTYHPSLPHDELMNSQFSQMTLYELRAPSIDLDKLDVLLNQSYRSSTSEGGLVPSSSAPPDARVVIIDEINRGNISRIFGELITLLEPSKRGGADESLEVILPYSKERFSVPQNVYIIGTMNTADRSLTGMDVALRRRFVFKPMPPRSELLEGIEIEGIVIGQLLSVLNQRIEALLDRDHCLGHAYFIPLRKTPTLDKLAEILSNQVLPLLQEYFFDDWQRIQWVLNDHRKPEAFQFISARAIEVDTLFGSNVNVANKPMAWVVNEEAFLYVESYLGVIDHRAAQDGE